MTTVLLLGTCDTKLTQLLYLRERILLTPNTSVTLLDVGRTNVVHPAITVTLDALLCMPPEPNPTRYDPDAPRSEHIQRMTRYATNLVSALFRTGSIQAMVAAGGSGGTSIAAGIMRDALPIGFPKLIVSTVASGDVGPLVRETDISLMYSVVDVAGMNSVLRDVLRNAGAFIAGAAHAYASDTQDQPDSNTSDDSGTKRIGITMFGVTTPAVDAIRAHLETRYGVEVFVFHATGAGGRALERLVREDRLHGVLDLTTTEVCDLIAGGVMSAGDTRLEAAAAAGLPNIVSLGAVDMVNFGPRETVPEKYRSSGRKLNEHNPVVTLMRISADEAKQVGAFIAEKLRAAKDPEMVQVWIPKGGVSMLSTAGQPFEDREVDEALFTAVRKGLEGSGVEVIEDERHVNDEGFARDIAEALAQKMGLVALKSEGGSEHE